MTEKEKSRTMDGEKKEKPGEEPKPLPECISKEEIPVEVGAKIPIPRTEDLIAWHPKTAIGQGVKNGKITHIDQLLDQGIRFMEPEIVDMLMPNLEIDLLLIGQAKGKFGGGQRRVFKQTQKKTPEGNKPKFATYAVCGNRNGYVGAGYGKAKETVPAREKAVRNAKVNLIKIRRGCGSWECGCREPHTIPFTVEGKCGSVKLRLMPAPKGTGLNVQTECQKILRLAGIKDIRSITFGQTRTSINLVRACMNALKNLMGTKVNPNNYRVLGITEGSTQMFQSPPEEIKGETEKVENEPAK